MPTQDIVISLKFNNYNYAPGIATYGIDGKTGIPGIDGNNIYFTDCNLLANTSNDLKILAELIANNYLPVKGSTIVVNRAYKNYDFFFDYNGIIYQLKDIDALINNKNIGGVYSDYFNIAGKIRITDDAGKFEWVGDRLVLNSSIYGGYDVITINNPELGESYINKDAVVNIISDNINENDNIEMIKMQSIDDVDIEDGKLSVYYKTTENAFYLDSNKPIVINGDVKIDNTADNPEYDEFSTVLTSNDTITYFKHICDKLRYNVLYDNDTNRYKLIIYSTEENDDDQRKTLEYLVTRNETIFGKIYTNENDLVLMKLSDVVYGYVNTEDYNNYIPAYDINSLTNNISTSSFNIKYINVNDSSIYINNTKNIDNKSITFDISLNSNLNNQIIALGTAASSSTFEDVIGDCSIAGLNYKNLVAPYGIALGRSFEIQDTDGFIEIIPTEPIKKNDILNVSLYSIRETETLYANILVDGLICDTTSCSATQSSETSSTKNIYNLTYQFDVDVNRPIKIGFPDKNFRLHKYSIIKWPIIPQNTTSTNYDASLMNNILGVNLSYIKNDNTYKLNDNGVFEKDKDIKISAAYNKSGRYKFIFNSDDIKQNDSEEKELCLDIVPFTEYNGEIPIHITFNTSGLNGLYALGFSLNHSDAKLSISDIMLDDKNAPESYSGDNRYYIQSYIPVNVESIQRFSLLHNTEVFLNYQE